jgi:predicted N-acyltransferase
MQSATTATLQARTVTAIADVNAAAWDALVPADNPFLSHAFLDALEASRSASDRSGWQPFHLVVEEGARLVAAAPLYVKSHSYGEYVFDHGWAEGYRRAGGSYYPKLLVAVPFTPVPGPRLLAASVETRQALIASLKAVLRQLKLSSLHVNFCTAEEAQALGATGFLLRRGIQFHWHNGGFADFEGWLDTLKSAKRKMVRKEREQVRAAGVTIEALHGMAVTEAVLDEFFPFYLATVDKRWGNAYLSREFFRRLGNGALRDRVVLMVARHEDRMVGAALNLRGTETLYGRQWGCLEEFKFLHFEACYYQAIEFAIRHGLKRVEAGAQGVHKLHRGYAPVFTHSAHLIADPGFNDAVARFLATENRAQDSEMGELQAALPYRNEA